MKSTKSQIAKLDEAKRELICQHLYLVKMIASKIAIFLPRHIVYEDLFHDGVVGLMDAAIKFDERIGKNFSSYASIRIKGSILDSLRSMDWIPRRIRKMSDEINKTREFLQQKLKREPSHQEISEHLRLPRERLSEIMSAVEQSRMFSFEELQTFSDKYFRSTKMAPQVKEGQSREDIEQMESREMLKSAISRLGDKEKLVLSLYYLEDLNLREIKQILNISEARISQIHTGAIKKLRREITEMRREKETAYR